MALKTTLRTIVFVFRFRLQQSGYRPHVILNEVKDQVAYAWTVVRRA